MSNKQQLQSNNETLASILSDVLGLPSQESLKHGAYVWKKKTYQEAVCNVTSTIKQRGTLQLQIILNGEESIFKPSYLVGKTVTFNGMYGTTKLVISSLTSGKFTNTDGTTQTRTLSYDDTTKVLTVQNVSLDDTDNISVNLDFMIEDSIKNFVGFVVSDSPTAYPDGGEQEGYWYEKVVEGIAGIDYGEITLASAKTAISVEHNLGVIPSWVALIPKKYTGAGSNQNSMNINGVAVYSSFGTGKIGKSETIVKFNTVSTSYTFKTGDYYWFAIA